MISLLKRVKTSANRTTRLDFLIILILGSIPILQSRFSGFFNWIDTNAPARFSSSRLFDLLFTWHRYDAYFGKDISFYFTKELPLQAIWSGLVHLGLYPEILQRLSFILAFVSMGWAMYFLTTTIFKTKYQRLASLLSALFFMYNPHTLGLVYYNSEIRLLLAAMIPALLGAFIRGLNSKKVINKYLFLVGFIFVILAASGNVQFIVLTLQLPIFYLIFYLTRNFSKSRLWHAVRFTSLCLIISALLSSFWLIPTAYNSNTILSQVLSIQEAKMRMVIPASSPQILSNMFLWRAGGGPNPLSTPYSNYYSSAPGQFIAVVLIITVFLSLLIKRKDHFVLFFVPIAILYLSLWSFIPNYARDVWLWLINNFPFGHLFFVSILDRFGPLIMACYAYLIGVTTIRIFRRLQNLSFSFFSNKINKAIPKIFIMIVVFIILLNSWPLLTWTLGDRKSVEIPDYYYQAGKWLDHQPEEFRIFSLPHHYYSLIYIFYDWQPYSSVDIIQQSGSIFPKPVIQLRPGDPAQPKIVKAVTNFFYRNIEYDYLIADYFEKVLSLMNIKYLLIREDVKPNIPSLTPEKMVNFLRNVDGLELEKKFGKLYFFKNDKFFPSLIYAAQNAP